MNLWNMAFLYIRKKWAESLLLFCIMLVIVMLALIEISIQRAAGTAELTLRKSFGGSFSFSVKKQNIKRGNQTYGLFDQKTIDRVMKHSGNSGVNADYRKACDETQERIYLEKFNHVQHLHKILRLS